MTLIKNLRMHRGERRKRSHIFSNPLRGQNTQGNCFLSLSNRIASRWLKSIYFLILRLRTFSRFDLSLESSAHQREALSSASNEEKEDPTFSSLSCLDAGDMLAFRPTRLLNELNNNDGMEFDFPIDHGVPLIEPAEPEPEPEHVYPPGNFWSHGVFIPAPDGPLIPAGNVPPAPPPVPQVPQEAPYAQVPQQFPLQLHPQPQPQWLPHLNQVQALHVQQDGDEEQLMQVDPNELIVFPEFEMQFPHGFGGDAPIVQDHANQEHGNQGEQDDAIEVEEEEDDDDDEEEEEEEDTIIPPPIQQFTFPDSNQEHLFTETPFSYFAPSSEPSYPSYYQHEPVLSVRTLFPPSPSSSNWGALRNWLWDLLAHNQGANTKEPSIARRRVQRSRFPPRMTTFNGSKSRLRVGNERALFSFFSSLRFPLN